MRTNPCFGCERRVVGCRPGCKEYKDWRAELDELNEARRREKAAAHLADEVLITGKGRRRR